MINWFEHLYPYTNVHELNLDWIIGAVKANEHEIKNFIGANIIKYADPIAWDISRQYEGNTVVIDPGTGDAYISVKAVPFGYDLSHIEYWTKIFNFGSTMDTLMAQIATNEGNSPTATASRNIGDLVFINEVLYEVTQNIPAGGPYINGTNISAITVERFVKNTKKRKFIFIGDSYAVGYVPGGSETEGGIVGFYNRAIAKLNLSPSDYTLIRWGRAGFVAQGVNGKTWIDDLSELDDDPLVTDIYVCGGLNDVAYGNGVATAINTFISMAKTKFPNATVSVGFVGRSALAESAGGAFDIVNLRTMRMIYKSATISNGGKYICGCEYILNYPGVMASDYYHPNDNGEELLSRLIVNDILGHDYVNTSSILTYSWINDGEVSTPGAWYGFVDGQHAEVLQTNNYVTLTLTNQTPKAINAGTYFKLFSLGNLPFAGDEYNTCNTLVHGVLIASDNKVFHFTGSLILNNNDVYLRMVTVEGTVTTPTLTVSSILLSQFCMNIDLVKCY